MPQTRIARHPGRTVEQLQFTRTELGAAVGGEPLRRCALRWEREHVHHAASLADGAWQRARDEETKGHWSPRGAWRPAAALGTRDEIGALSRSISVFQHAMRRNQELNKTVLQEAELRGALCVDFSLAIVGRRQVVGHQRSERDSLDPAEHRT